MAIYPKQRRTVMVEGYELIGMGGIANVMEEYLLSLEEEEE